MRRRICLGILIIVTMIGVLCAIVLMSGVFREKKQVPREVVDLLWEAERGRIKMDYEEAESTYKEIIREYGDSSHGLKAQSLLVQLYLNSGHADLADKACEDLKTRFSGQQDTPLMIAVVAYHYRRGGNSDKSFELLMHAINNWPKKESSLKAYQDLAVLLIELGREDDAKAVIEKLIDNLAGNTRMVVTAMMIAHTSRFRDGEEDDRSVYQYVTDIISSRLESEDEICSRGLTVAFDVMFEGGGGADVIDELMTDFEGHPDLGGVLHHIGFAYILLGGFYERQDKEERADECTGKSIAMWERIGRELPDSKAAGSAYSSAAFRYKRLGRLDKELECLQKAVELWSDERTVCKALSGLARCYNDLLHKIEMGRYDGAAKLGREEGAAELCEISRRIISDFPDERFYVREAESYLERWESTAANYVLLEESSEAALPGELGGYWEKLAGPVIEDEPVGRIAFGRDGVLWVLIDARPHYWDGKVFHAARIDNGPDAANDAVSARGGSRDPDKFINVFWGGDGRPLYISQFGTKKNVKRLYKLAEGKAVYVTDYHDERTERYGPFRHFYVSKSGTLINWGKNFQAAYVDGKWTRIEVPRGSGPIADVGGKVYFQRGGRLREVTRGSGPIADRDRQIDSQGDGRLHWVDREGNFGDRKGIEAAGEKLSIIPWGDDKLVLRRTNPAHVYNTKNWQRMPAVEEKINSMLGSRSILDGFPLSDGSLWLLVPQQVLGGVFVIVSPDCEIRMATETLQLGWSRSQPLGYKISSIEASDGSLWFATRKKGIARWTDGKLDFYGWRQGNSMGSAAQLLEGPEGTIYAAYADGVYAYRPERKAVVPGWVKQWEEYSLAASNMVQDFEGNIWVALKKHPDEISRWDGQAWTHISVPFDTSIRWQVTVDDRGHLLWQRSKSSYDISVDGAIHYEDSKAMIAAAVADGAKKFLGENRGFMGAGWNKKSSRSLRRFFGGKELACDLRDTPLFGNYRDIRKVFEDRSGNVWIEELGYSESGRTVFVKRNTDFRLEAEEVPAEAFRSIEMKVESLVGESKQVGTRIFWRIDEGQWCGGKVEDSIAIEFLESGKYDIEIVGMGPVGGLTGNRVKFSVEAAVPSPETILTTEGAYKCEDVIWEIPAEAEACDGCNPAEMRYRINGGEWEEAYEGRMAVFGGLDAGEYVVEVGAFEDEKYFDRTPLVLAVRYEPDYGWIVGSRVESILSEDGEVVRRARTEIKMGGAAVIEPLMEEAVEAGRMTRFGRIIERLALEIGRTAGR